MSMSTEAMAHAPSDRPLSDEDELLSTSLVRRKLNVSTCRSTIHLKIGGQLLVFYRITNSRINSKTVTPPIKNRWIHKMEQARSHLFGKNAKDITIHVETEV